MSQAAKIPEDSVIDTEGHEPENAEQTEAREGVFHNLLSNISAGVRRRVWIALLAILALSPRLQLFAKPKNYPPEIKFACKVERAGFDSPFTPKGFRLVQITEIPIPGMNMDVKNINQNEHGETLLTITLSYLIPRSKPEGGHDTVVEVQYENQYRIPVGGEYMCSFQRVFPPVSSNEEDEWEEIKHIRKKAYGLIDASDYFTEQENSEWTKRFSNIQLTYEDAEILLNELRIDREQKWRERTGNVPDAKERAETEESSTIVSGHDDVSRADALIDEINAAYSAENYSRVAELLDDEFRTTDVTDPAAYSFAVVAYVKAKQKDKAENVCEAGAEKATMNTDEEKRDYIDFLNICAKGLIGTKSSTDKGLQYLLKKYTVLTGKTSKRELLEEIARNQEDAMLMVAGFQRTGRHQEASDLLTFFFQSNPSLMTSKNGDPTPFDVAWGLHFAYHEPSAYTYCLDKRREARWEKRWERILQIAIPAVIIGGAIYKNAQAIEREETQRAAAERKRAEELERQRQAERRVENDRRARLGLPSLEAEERQREEQLARERERIRGRCLDQCVTNYHSCMSTAGDPDCCESLRCPITMCPSSCEGSYATCRYSCD